MAEQLEYPYGTINVELVGAWLHMKPEDDGCFWALNLMKYVEVANYDDGREGVSGKAADDAFAAVQGVTQVALFDVEGVIIGDERRYDRARFVRVNDDESLESLISAAGNAGDAQILVLRSFIDNLVDTVVTA